jgi:predicted amidophosphoribosyltransferase
MGDLIEDVLAFLYATGDRKRLDGGNSCSNCGADLKEDDEGNLSCPDCG